VECALWSFTPTPDFKVRSICTGNTVLWKFRYRMIVFTIVPISAWSFRFLMLLEMGDNGHLARALQKRPQRHHQPSYF
jgi:hypothetical protein